MIHVVVTGSNLEQLPAKRSSLVRQRDRLGDKLHRMPVRVCKTEALLGSRSTKGRIASLLFYLVCTDFYRCICYCLTFCKKSVYV